MIETDLFEIIDPILRTAGTVVEEGDEYRTPPLDVLRYYCRPVRLHWFPILGRALGVVAVVRQPVDVGLSTADYRRFLSRLAMAVNSPLSTLAPPGGPGHRPDLPGPDPRADRSRRRCRPGDGPRPFAPHAGRPARGDPGQPRPGGDVARVDLGPRQPLPGGVGAGRGPDAPAPAVRPLDGGVRTLGPLHDPWDSNHKAWGSACRNGGVVACRLERVGQAARGVELGGEDGAREAARRGGKDLDVDFGGSGGGAIEAEGRDAVAGLGPSGSPRSVEGRGPWDRPR